MCVKACVCRRTTPALAGGPLGARADVPFNLDSQPGGAFAALHVLGMLECWVLVLAALLVSPPPAVVLPVSLSSIAVFAASRISFL